MPKRQERTQYRRNKPVVVITDIEGVRNQQDIWKNKTNKPGYISAVLALFDNAFLESNNPKMMWHYNDCRINICMNATWIIQTLILVHWRIHLLIMLLELSLEAKPQPM